MRSWTSSMVPVRRDGERADREERLHQPRAREIPVADERPGFSLGQRQLHGGELELARGGQDQIESSHRELQMGDGAGGHASCAAEPPMFGSDLRRA